MASLPQLFGTDAHADDHPPILFTTGVVRRSLFVRPDAEPADDVSPEWMADLISSWGEPTPAPRVVRRTRRHSARRRRRSLWPFDHNSGRGTAQIEMRTS